MHSGMRWENARERKTPPEKALARERRSCDGDEQKGLGEERRAKRRAKGTCYRKQYYVARYARCLTLFSAKFLALRGTSQQTMLMDVKIN